MFGWILVVQNGVQYSMYEVLLLCTGFWCGGGGLWRLWLLELVAFASLFLSLLMYVCCLAVVWLGLVGLVGIVTVLVGSEGFGDGCCRDWCFYLGVLTGWRCLLLSLLRLPLCVLGVLRPLYSTTYVLCKSLYGVLLCWVCIAGLRRIMQVTACTCQVRCSHSAEGSRLIDAQFAPSSRWL